ncbi:MAG: hypothetical protein ABSG62_13340, partial [Terracidiphilus sp.]
MQFFPGLKLEQRGFIRLPMLAVVGLASVAAICAQQQPALTIHWDKTTVVSVSTPTLQVVVNPPLRPGQP